MTLLCSSAERTTPPLPTFPLPTSNCGLISATTVASVEISELTAGRTSLSEINETSMVASNRDEWQTRWFQITNIGFFENNDARIVSQFPIELAITDIHREDLRGAMAEANNR